jgi:NAD(P)-dependent dehydrogenase (short-subunit alcohol dehydrogenase family)
MITQATPSPARPAPPAVTRRIMVTGASSGIGRATVVRLADAGHVVFAAARRANALEELATRPPIERLEECAGAPLIETVKRSKQPPRSSRASSHAQAPMVQAVRRRGGTAVGLGRPARPPAQAQGSAAAPAAGRAPAEPGRW